MNIRATGSGMVQRRAECPSTDHCHTPRVAVSGIFYAGEYRITHAVNFLINQPVCGKSSGVTKLFAGWRRSDTQSEAVLAGGIRGQLDIERAGGLQPINLLA